MRTCSATGLAPPLGYPTWIGVDPDDEVGDDGFSFEIRVDPAGHWASRSNSNESAHIGTYDRTHIESRMCV